MRVPAIRLWLCGVLLALAGAILAVSPAGAHAQLESSDPADGAVLAEPPAAVAFTFGENLLDKGNAIVVTELASSTRLTTGPVVVAGPTASVTWPSASPAGEYRAAYRVVSADGHPIAGSITFTVRSGLGASPSAPPAATSTPIGTPSAAVADDPATDDADGQGAVQPAWFLGIGLVVLLAAGGGAWYLRRTR